MLIPQLGMVYSDGPVQKVIWIVCRNTPGHIPFPRNRLTRPPIRIAL
ncbi:MAG: hypothetical protein AB8A49_02260 [Prochlorococcus sp.]|nr:hypothetical protein [Prochlorococcaceae cyanobacterium ETNP2_MAG_10]MDP6196582.1 hypothetical protein [Prochlorococcaceae cyanobacterium ETNP18_MAG_17]MDP6321354.1 hypothetical protein [Prochlorococcaceae cyanobacterium ETNP14_MAG_5]MDP6851147.1 hypothetical protein [Prochlorococcaceae cyanobacterium ETNP1_MAG_8]